MSRSGRERRATAGAGRQSGRSIRNLTLRRCLWRPMGKAADPLRTANDFDELVRKVGRALIF
jgi:hypothetical protein